jgi:PadR family transcriptional regulator PadR
MTGRRELGSLEQRILEAALDGVARGDAWFHGYRIAKAIAAERGHAALVGHGTLYKALARLERAGYVESRWEDPALGVRESRPRRRLYRVTGEGAAALAQVSRAQPQLVPTLVVL